MTRIFLGLFYFCFFIACKKADIEKEKVLFNLKIDPREVVGDGQTTVNISVELDADADPLKRNVIFRATAGSFGNSTDTFTTTKADFQDKLLVAQAKLKIPPRSGTIVISAEPELKVAYGDFILRDSIVANPSIPVKINLEASSLSVKTDFGDEIQLTGFLKNSKNGNVSIGNKVEFKDYFMDNTEVHGNYRAVQASSDPSSKVSAIYSPGYVGAGKIIYIRCTLLNSAESISDTVYVNVTKID